MSVISTSAPRLRLPDQVSIDFGPTDLMGHAFLALDREARDRGIYLSISHDLDGLVDINQRNLADWYPLPPMLDASFGGMNEENAFWLCGVDEHGEVVATQAARLYVWQNETFGSEWENLGFVYPSPETQSLPGECATVTSEIAWKMTGRVCHTGALWIRSDQRGKGMAYLLPRLTRAYALTRWYPDYMVGVVKTALVDRGMARTYGWRKTDRSIIWQNSRLGDLELATCWMETDEVTDDLGQFTTLLQNRGLTASLV